MKPGIYFDMPFQDYLEEPGIHQSTLKLMGCPEKFRHFVDNPKEATAEMELGSAVHCCVLEAERFRKKYLCHQKMDKRTKEWKEFKASVPLGVELTGFETVEISKSALRIGSLKNLLEEKDTLREVSIFWVDDICKLECKARLDIWNERLNVLTDIKTTKSASPAGFAREVFTNSYHIQAALYRRGLKKLGKKAPKFLFSAVETKPPYSRAAYNLVDEVIELGETQCIEYLEKYAECVKSGVWPGYSEDVQYIGIPQWSYKQLEEEYGE